MCLVSASEENTIPSGLYYEQNNIPVAAPPCSAACLQERQPRYQCLWSRFDTALRIALASAACTLVVLVAVPRVAAQRLFQR